MKFVTLLAASAAVFTVASAAQAEGRFEGYYAGADLAYGFGVAEKVAIRYTDERGTVSFGEMSVSGVLIGAHFGERMSLNGDNYIGYEIGLQISQVSDDLVNGSVSAHNEGNWTLSLSANAGRLVNEKTLAYGLLGAEVASFDYGVSDGVNMHASNDDLRFVSFFGGAGITYAVNDTWSVRGEYRYTQFGNEQVVSPRGVNVSKATIAYSSVNLGMSYNF